MISVAVAMSSAGFIVNVTISAIGFISRRDAGNRRSVGAGGYRCGGRSPGSASTGTHHLDIIHDVHSASGRSNGAVTLQLDFLFETLLFGGNLGLRLQPVLDRFPFRAARLFPDLVSPLAYPLL